MTQLFPQTSAKDQSDLHFIKFTGRGETQIKIFSVEQFMTATGLVYLPELEFQDEEVLQRIRMQCSHALEIGTIGTDSRWLGALHAREIGSHYIADVSIRWIDETIGFGLFAEKDIAAWEYIGEYTGLVRRLNLIFGNINEYCFGFPTSAFSFRKHVIDSLNRGNEIRYANHSDSPNSESMAVLFDNILHSSFGQSKIFPPLLKLSTITQALTVCLNECVTISLPGSNTGVSYKEVFSTLA